MKAKPRTFEHFPKTATCPVCNTSDDGECILIGIDGTIEGRICQAKPVHLWCAVAEWFNAEAGVIYTQCMEEG